MSNMSYCRFRNTEKDLRDCYENLFEHIEDEEYEARENLIQLCVAILIDFGYTVEEE